MDENIAKWKVRRKVMRVGDGNDRYGVRIGRLDVQTEDVSIEQTEDDTEG